MATYTVRARRWPGGWELHIDGAGVTACASLDDAEQTARDYLETLTGRSAVGDRIVIAPEEGETADMLLAANPELSYRDMRDLLMEYGFDGITAGRLASGRS